MAGTRAVSGWRSRFPELGVEPLSIEPIVSGELFELERERIFKRVWLKAGRVEEIPEPGCFKVKRLDVARTSVILIRGKDNAIRAFHNVCPHRGNRVIPETDNETFGRARADYLTCRFHGWVFDSTGAVRNVPSLEKFPPYFDQCNYGLKPVSCDVWEGFIFINLDPEPRQDLVDYLDGMAPHFTGYPYHEGTAHYRYTAEFNCNWKVALNAFTEAYHVETIHANTLPWYAKIDHENLKFYGPHRTSTLYMRLVEGAKVAEPAPIDGLALRIMQESPRQQFVMDKLPADINPERRGNFLFELPSRFAELEFLVERWALPAENQRSAKRWSASREEFQELYDAMVPRINEILTYLDQFPLEDMPEDAIPLFHLSLALAEAAPHIEFYQGAAKVPHSFDARRMLATRGDAPDPNHDMSPSQLAAFKPLPP